MNICSFLFSPVYTFIQEDEVNESNKIKESHLDRKKSRNTKTVDVMAKHHLVQIICQEFIF